MKALKIILAILSTLIVFPLMGGIIALGVGESFIDGIIGGLFLWVVVLIITAVVLAALWLIHVVEN